MGKWTRRRWRWGIIACPVVLVASLAMLGARRADITPYEWSAIPLAPERETSVCARTSQVKTFLEVECQYQQRHAPALEVEDQYPSSRSTALELEAVYPVPLLEVENSYPEPVAVVNRAIPPSDVAAAVAPAPQLPAEMPKLVALTFDTEIPHGAEARRTLTQVLDSLREAGVRATFFVVGSWAHANPGVLRRLIGEGHEIANHSLTHQRFAGRPVRELRTELDEVADVVLHETGASITPFFRPPYGCIDAAATELARQDGYQLAGWTGTGRDATSKTHTAGEVVAAVKPHLHGGDVILLHTNHWITAAALPTLLQLITERGLEAVPVSELLQRDPTSAVRLAHGGLSDCTVRTAHLTQNRQKLTD